MVYYELVIPDLEESNLKKEVELDSQNFIGETPLIKYGFEKKPPEVLSSTIIEGDYVKGGFFTHNEFISLDADGSVYVLKDYDDMKNKASSATSKYFKMDYTVSQTWPDQVDVYYPLKEENSPYTISSMFTPAFEEATNIKGKIHVVSHFDTSYFDSITIILKVNVSIFDPSNGNITEIASHEEILPDNMNSANQKVFELILNDIYIIPAGNRLKLTFQAKVNDIDAQGEVQLSSSRKGAGTYDWVISDGEYSNSYTFGGYNEILGMQIYFKSATYPEIIVTGITNSTYYYEEKNIQISVTGAVSSSYRWNLDNYTSFTSETNTDLPTTEGWHYLEVRANDDYNNTAIEVYDIGYDPTESSLILNNADNNTFLHSASILDFTAFGANSILCEWDDNGTLIELLTLSGHNLSVPIDEGYHNLSICLNDTFKIEYYYYYFGIDANSPLISLHNVANDTKQAAGKLIEVIITDFSTNLEINYKWNDNIFLPWTPSVDTIYQTYLPETEGFNNLTVTAEDIFGHFILQMFRFNVSSETLLVELRTMQDESWYQGGDIVEVTISGTNGTVLFKWDDGIFNDGIPFLVSQILTLDGIHTLPSDISFYHYLTILVGDIDNKEHMFVYEFRIDTENPVIDSSILIYNNERFKNTEDLIFILSDNATEIPELIVLISIDGSSNITLNDPYLLDLSPFLDGLHNFTLYVFDIAGNSVSQFIEFYIDSSAPVIIVESIEGLVTLPDASMYVPYGSTIVISATDDDPIFILTYSWDGSLYQIFTDTINLDYSDGEGLLIINGSDSIGNQLELSYILTIDSQAPEITLTFPFEYSSINDYTSLLFNADDISQKSIDLVKYYWDARPETSLEIILDSNGDFDVILLAPYSTGDIATLAIYTEDVVGNNNTYFFNFEVDFTPPDSTLYIFDEDLGEYVDALDYDYITISTELWYDNTTSSDLSIFIYYWNDENGQILNDPWLIESPAQIGLHNLTIILRDCTGEETSPNEIEVVFSFTIKKEGSLTILKTSENSCVYGENITIDVNLKDESMNDLNIIEISVNGTSMSFRNIADYDYQFDFPSSQVNCKGHFTLQIGVQSDFYFGSTNENLSFEITIEPIPLKLALSVSNLEIVEGSTVAITGILTYIDGSPVVGYEINFIIYIFYKSDQSTVEAAREDFNDYTMLNDTTGSDGRAIVDFLLTENVSSIAISASFQGSDILGFVSFDFEEEVKTIKAGLSPVFLYSIIGGSIFLLVLVSLLIYFSTKRKPFEKYLNKIPSQDLMMKLNEICPGVILSIFNQRTGPVPLLSDHSFSYDYAGRFALETENFLLKLCDQAYSTLGFEDIHQGRKTSALNLPNEGLVGFVHAIQLENKKARGGFENLSIIIITQADYGTLLLTYSEYIFQEIDELISSLEVKKSADEIKEQILKIRRRATHVILAAIEETN
ncbi:MAG: hypothetical protein HGN29_04260 [Asgard group archaeon]|nr:hypothetical protein [Asgard group archaeon]